ncbi:MAG: pentapeptide repeat-containing protein [Thermomicrobiales bacterium]
MSGCDFDGRDFSGDDLSGSSMVGTNFTNAELVGTDLSSSNMRNAVFRGANLCGADLSSSQLRNADFRGFAPLGRSTNLTLADLSSSGCAGIDTNQFTFICGTTWCDGSVRNDSCPGGPPPDFCCPGCTGGAECVDNQCVVACEEPGDEPGDCVCFSTLDGNDSVCVDISGPCGNTCTANDPCDPGFVCTFSPCCPALPGGAGVCNPPCPFPADCFCETGPAVCGAEFVGCGLITEDGLALRRAGGSPQKPSAP